MSECISKVLMGLTPAVNNSDSLGAGKRCILTGTFKLAK